MNILLMPTLHFISPPPLSQDQELDGRMWFKGMHYNCWGQEDGGEEL